MFSSYLVEQCDRIYTVILIHCCNDKYVCLLLKSSGNRSGASCKGYRLVTSVFAYIGKCNTPVAGVVNAVEFAIQLLG